MKISTEAHKLLKEKLPNGSASRIKERLERKNLQFSIGYIYKVIDPDYPEYNPDIIAEAIAIIDSIDLAVREQEAKIFKICQV